MEDCGVMTTLKTLVIQAIGYCLIFPLSGQAISSDNAVWDTLDAPNVKYSLAMHASGPVILLGTYGYAMRTLNDGATWVEHQGPSISVIHGFSMHGANAYAAAFTDGILRSVDSGLSWQRLAKTGMGNNTFHSVLATDSFLFAGSYYNGVFRAPATGGAWEQMDSGLSSRGVFVNFLKIGHTILAGTFYDGVYRTTNNGAHWTRPSSRPSDSLSIASLASCGTVTYASAATQGVWVSRDTGSTWTSSRSGFPDGVLLRSVACRDSQVFAGTDAHAIYLSLDTGKTWSHFVNGLPDTLKIKQLITSSGYLYALSQTYSLWRIPISPMTPTNVRWEPLRVRLRLAPIDRPGDLGHSVLGRRMESKSQNAIGERYRK
jgi:photosystem II stability/assembly factor-like uncharacterized protein